MTRHARNCTAGSVYTYHERKKDAAKSGYGSKSARLGKDSIRNFDCCSLTLQPCRNPVVSTEGYLFDKEAILEYYLEQKKMIKKRLKDYEKQKSKDARDLADLAKAEKEAQIAEFSKKEDAIISKPVDPFNQASTSEESESVSNLAGARAKALPSFWIPSLTPAAAPHAADQGLTKKPDEKVRCPLSGKPLKIKELVPIHFTPANKDGSKSLHVDVSKDARYVCAVTNDVLGNSVPCAALKPSGCVVTMECVDKLLRKDNPMLDPINGKPLADSDIIQLQRGASGFAGSGHVKVARVAGASMMA